MYLTDRRYDPDTWKMPFCKVARLSISDWIRKYLDSNYLNLY